MARTALDVAATSRAGSAPGYGRRPTASDDPSHGAAKSFLRQDVGDRPVRGRLRVLGSFSSPFHRNRRADTGGVPQHDNSRVEAIPSCVSMVVTPAPARSRSDAPAPTRVPHRAGSEKHRHREVSVLFRMPVTHSSMFIPSTTPRRRWASTGTPSASRSRTTSSQASSAGSPSVPPDRTSTSSSPNRTAVVRRPKATPSSHS